MASDKTQPFVSIIVPVYKVENYLRICLNSILAQSYSNWEAILVDDGSPDACPQIIDKYAEQDERFRTIHRKNGGLSAARNSGLQIVKGEYITFLDGDDFWHKDFLKSMVEAATENDADIVQCDFVRGADNVFPDLKDTTFDLIKIYDRRSIFTSFVAKVIVWGKIYRKYILEGITFPEGRVNEDDFTNWRFYYKADKIAVTKKKLYYYTVNPNSIMGTLKKKPDLRFIDAYNERISFFEHKDESDLVATSRIQLLKSLSLLAGFPDKEIHRKVCTELHTQYKALRHSSFKTPSRLMAIFSFVNACPWIGGKAIAKLYSHGVR
jgi:hypothetical protein